MDVAAEQTSSRPWLSAELLRSFGARSDSKPVWRISMFTNVSLVIVVAISFGLQVWSQRNATLGRFLKTSFVPVAEGFLRLAARSPC